MNLVLAQRTLYQTVQKCNGMLENEVMMKEGDRPSQGMWLLVSEPDLLITLVEENHVTRSMGMSVSDNVSC
jgi:hypothetical protein